MYSKILEPKIDEMFSEINYKILKIVINSPTLKTAEEKIDILVSSETTIRSKTMLSDMYMELSKKVLDSLPDTSQKISFYETNLRQEIFDKYSFKNSDKNFELAQYSRLKISLITGVLTAALGYMFIFFLPSKLSLVSNISVFTVAAAVFCILYFKVIKNINKRKIDATVNTFIKQTKNQYIKWFDEIEVYFNNRVAEIKEKM